MSSRVASNGEGFRRQESNFTELGKKVGVGSLNAGYKRGGPICEGWRGREITVVVDISTEEVGDGGLGT